ncbi:thrombin-like enzyme ancrod [Biomphalaria glabrata]|uniref:Thrombin-like enzyme ancrod n=1 Tax=Biomphalaria glabrata TaxID=6526 RepID=A0A9W2YEF6_BIOGL|nr:thrombin-like enzyme ancrod [Biomphalaria glabrata]
MIVLILTSFFISLDVMEMSTGLGPVKVRSIPCRADSGGPLMCGKYLDELVGVLSRGPADCVGNAPALYVNLSAYRDWLADKL